MTNQRALLIRALQANAALSLATGSLLAAAGPTVGDWLGIASAGGWLRVFGVLLLGHAVGLVWATRQENVETLGRLNLAMIGPYPLLLIALVAAGVIHGASGIVLGLGDAAAVGTLAVLQFLGLQPRRTLAAT